MADFKLAAQLQGHEADVRAVSFPNPDTVLTTSRDKTIRIWRKDTPKYDCTLMTQGSEYINSLAYLPPSSEFPDGLVVTGSKDAIIDVRKLDSHQGDHSLFMLVGHAGNVCALDILPGGKHIISGGWDGQARLWGVGKWDTEVELMGHGQSNPEYKSVTAVAAVDSQTVFTGCADKMIRGYALKKTRDGKCDPVKTIQTPDVVRALCALPKGHASGASIASASNDGVIRLWAADGTQVAELHGHESYIYSLAYLPSGEIVSSGEDRTVRIWKGTECIQTITHPAISVWSVAVCQESGDIVTGASDNIARIFTRKPDRVADAETLAQFTEAVQTSAIPQQQMPTINKENMDGPDFLEKRAGIKDGQTVMIKQPDGSVTAHIWSMSEQEWTMVGTVVDSAASGAKVEFDGKQYDHVFEVDIEDGKPKLKLPYNLSENPYDAARRFLDNNDLPVTYLESVARFITDNTKGASLDGAQASQPSQPTVEQTTERTPEATTLPHKDYILFQQSQLGPLQKKLTQINADKVAVNDKDYTMGPPEVKKTLAKLVDILNDALKNTPGALPASAAGIPRPFNVEEEYLQLVIKTSSRWAYTERLPGLDLLRCSCLSQDLAEFTDERGDIIDIAIAAATSDTRGANEKLIASQLMMVFRAVANLFATQRGRMLAKAKADQVFQLMGLVTGSVKGNAMGDVSGPVGKDNRNMLIALTSTAINYSVLAVAHQGVFEKDALTPLLNVLGGLVREQTDREVVFRSLVALGTILSSPGSEHIKAAAKEMGVLKKAQDQASDVSVKSLAKKIENMLG